MSGHKPRGLPDSPPPPHKNYSLYEDIEYRDYWNDPAQVRQDLLEKRIISDWLPASGRRIIDVGCGYGRLVPCYLGRFDKIVLYDGSLSLLRQARKAAGEGALCVAGDVENLPFKAASFDHILSIRVLQHVRALRMAFGEMGRILSKEGHLIFSYHNKRNLHRIMQWLRSRRIANPFSPETKEVSANLLSHHPTEIGRLLREAGFMAPVYKGAVVLDPLAKLTEKAGRRAPAGLAWARFAGTFKLAPWLIGRATAGNGRPLRVGNSVEDLFECPTCHGNLCRSGQDFACPGCGRVYPVRDGISDFRL